MNEQNVVYPCNGILFHHKKKWSTDACHNVWISKTYKVEEASHKRQHIIGFDLHEMSGKGKFTDKID